MAAAFTEHPVGAERVRPPRDVSVPTLVGFAALVPVAVAVATTPVLAAVVVGLVAGLAVG